MLDLSLTDFDAVPSFHYFDNFDAYCDIPYVTVFNFFTDVSSKTSVTTVTNLSDVDYIAVCYFLCFVLYRVLTSFWYVIMSVQFQGGELCIM